MSRYATISAICLVLCAPARASTPDSGWVVWASDRQDGRHEIYLMQADGSGVARLTGEGAVYPGWSPDARWIAYTATDDESTRVMRWTGEEDKQVCEGAFEFWMWDGSGLVCRIDDEHHLVNPDTGADQLLFSKSDFSALGPKSLNPGGITHDGRWLVAHSDIYRSGYSGDNGSFTAYHAAVILDLNDKSKLYFFGQGCEPTTPPAGDLVYHVCGGGPCDSHPDPYRMKLGDVATRASYAPEIAHADEDWGHEYFPRVSNDNLWLAYGATTGCHEHDTCDYEIYIHKLGAGNDDRTRITDDPANDQWPHLWVGTLPVLCSTDGDCDDGDACTADSCDPTTRECQHSMSCASEAGSGPPSDGGQGQHITDAGGGALDGGARPALSPAGPLLGSCALGSAAAPRGGAPLLLALLWWLRRRGRQRA